MFHAFALALADTFAARQRPPLLISIRATLVLLAGLWFGATALLAGMQLSSIGWLDFVLHIFGSFAALVVAWVLFPATSMLVLGFLLDRVIATIEAQHYPDLPPPRPVGIAATLASTARLLVLAIVINVALLPLYFVPVVGQLAYYWLNGWLVGRQYFEQVALRRMNGGEVRALWRRHRAPMMAAGAVIAFLLTVPFFDLAAPLTGAAFMVHLVEARRRRG